MALERLWAGWRAPFVEGAAVEGAAGAGPDPAEDPGAGDPYGPSSCVFCRILASPEPDSETHVLWRHPGGRVIALLNAYPYTSGHLMLMPVRHVGDLEALDQEEAAAVMEGAAAAVRAIKSAYHPDGLNVGANLGAAAGAGVPGHFHLHVLPRWSGDTNFMTAVAETRVLPEALPASADKLRRAWPL